MLRLEDLFPQESEGVEDPFPQGPEGPAQLSRGFISPAVLLFPLQYFSWGPVGGRRGFAGAKAFGTADQTAVREPYDFAVSEAQAFTSRFSYGFPIFWIQLPLLLPLPFFPVSVIYQLLLR